MYLDHFGLDEPPFRITPHTDFFFDGADRGTTLEGLLYAIQYDEGIVKVSGEVGSGKTMLCRVLMERLPENVETIYLANPSFTRDEILRAIADDLKLETSGDSARVLTRDLQAHLIESHARGRRVVILIDEAHAMPEDSLEQVRLLSNLETSRHKLLQIVLFGQPELDQMLAATSLRQLRDRITHSFRMRPLTQEEVSRYVTFRLRAAGYRGPDLFTRKAIALLTRASDGLTRRINILADKALLSAFALDTHAVDERHVQRAIADSELAPLATAKRPLAYVAAALAAGAVLGVLLHWVFTDRAPDGTGRAPASPPAESAKAVPAKPEQPVVAAAPRPAEKPVVAPKPRALPASGGQAASAPPLAKAPPAVPEKPSTPSPVHDSSAPASTKADDPSTSTSASPAKPVVSAPLMARVESQGVPARLLPEQIERMLDLQLEIGQQLNAGQVQRLQPLDGERTDGIVSPARVADADDEPRGDPGRGVQPHRSCESFTSVSIHAPSASNSSMLSGIRPSAWVAQDRQGSKARIATSIWFSRPSVSFRPLR